VSLGSGGIRTAGSGSGSLGGADDGGPLGLAQPSRASAGESQSIQISLGNIKCTLDLRI
jgi:hypothetical protein